MLIGRGSHLDPTFKHVQTAGRCHNFRNRFDCIPRPKRCTRGAVADPRDANLGWRYYGAEDHATDAVDWDALRVDHKIPEMGRELDAESYILEMGFEGLNGVDFEKAVMLAKR